MSKSNKIECIVKSYYAPHGFKYVVARHTNGKEFTYGIKAFEEKFGKPNQYPMCYDIDNHSQNEDDNLDFLD